MKIANEHQKRFARSEEKRKKDFRQKRKFYLIVCEGAKTEPNYFNCLKKDLPKGVLTYYQIDIEGTGRNTRSLIDEAIRLQNEYEKEHNRPLDRLWVVFDRDSFTADDFNSAITRCIHAKPEIGCAWSNEAFELWYLLHFQCYENSIPRRDYKGFIENNLRPHTDPDFVYLKNSENMYQLLKKLGSTTDAIRNGKRLAQRFQGRQDYANHNPCTMVWRLVEELNELKQS